MDESKFKRSMGAALLLGTMAAMNPASAIVIGTDTGQGNCIPFGCTRAPFAYQQVYDAGSFVSAISINSISFYRNNPWQSNGAMPSTGGFTFSLSTTSRGVDALSTTPSLNIGADNSQVFSGSLPTFVALGTQMDILLDSTFDYDPNLGNLLLTVESANAITPLILFYLDVAISDDDDMSRLLTRGNFTRFTRDSAALVTGFNEADWTIPEPAPLALMGLSLAGIGYQRRKQDEAA